MMKDRFRDMRKALGLNQDELSSKLGIPLTTVSKYERGENKPSVDMLAKYGERLNLNLHWLLTGQGEMFLATTQLPSTDSHEDIAKETYNLLKKVESKIDNSLHQKTPDLHEPSPRYGYNVIPFPSKRPWRLGVLSHASGMGEVCIVDDEVYIEGHISVELPERADFAVPARGTSMEPLIPNGSLLYVRRILPNELRDGDLALCWLREQYAGMVRRVFFQEGHEQTDVCLQSDNPRENKWYPYDPEIIVCGCKVVGWEVDQVKVAELLKGME